MKTNDIIVGIYCRLSRDDDEMLGDNSESIYNQKNMLTQYATERKWEIFDYYIDDGFTGLNFDRPGFDRLKQDISSNKINVLLVKDQSRIGRDNAGVDRFLYEYLSQHNIRCIGILDGLDTTNKQNKKASQVMGLTNEWYAEDISNKVKGAFDAKRKNGEFIGAIAPYGYKKSPQNKNKLIIDEEVSWVIKKIYNLYLEGNGYVKIAKLLNEEDIPSPSIYKNIFNSNAEKIKKNKRMWSYHTIRRMLMSEVYVGNLVQKTQKVINYKSKKKIATHPSEHIRVENTHEALIDKKTFELAQSMIKKKTKARPYVGRIHLFSGIMRCGDCGRVLHYRADHDVLECGTFKEYGLKYCTPHKIKGDRVNEILSEDIKNKLNAFNDISIQEKVYNNYTKTQKRKKYIDNEISKLEKRISEIEKLKKSLYEDYKKEILSKEEYLNFKNSYIEENCNLVLKKDSLIVKKTESESVVNNHDTWKSVYEKYIDSKELTREMLIELVDEIYVYENEETKELTLDIQYKYKNHFVEYIKQYDVSQEVATEHLGGGIAYYYQNIISNIDKEFIIL